MKVTVLGKEIDVAPLEVLRLVACATGHEDVDVDPAPGKTTIKFTKNGVNASPVNGVTLEDACQKFFQRVLV